MADLRVQLPVKVVDPTTNSQELGITASGEAKVSLTTAVPAGTNNIGDVDVLTVITGTGATNLGKAEDAGHNSGDTGVFVLAVRSDTAAATGQTDGDYTALVTDSTGRLWCNVSNTVTVASHAVTNAGTFAVQVDGAALTALQLIDDVVYVDDADWTDDTSKHVLVGGLYQSSPQSITDGDVGPLEVTENGYLKVAVMSGAGSDTPTNPVSVTITPASVSAGSSSNFDTGDVAAKYLWKVDIAASVNFKAVLSTLDNGVAAPVTTLFGQAGTTVQWTPPNRAFVLSGSSGGADGFRIAFTNLDTSEASDAHVTFHYSDN